MKREQCFQTAAAAQPNDNASWFSRAAPWLAGAGIAAGHVAVSANCTIPQQGRCGACGSCIVAVGSLVGWALLKKRQGQGFYDEDQVSS